MTKERQERSCNLDLIRIFAFLCVIAVHAFMNCEFYDLSVAGVGMLVATCLRNFFMICVPLFLLLSGYLMKDKTPCRAYYFKLIRILGIYLLASILCGAYKLIYDGENFSFSDAVSGLFDFVTAGYSWYIEMYIGLFLMIPYLNKMYRGGSQRSKKLLVLTFLFLTALPSMANIWRFSDPSWWLRPSENREYQGLVPVYWQALYPVTFYFIGNYLREYPLKLKPLTGLLLLIGVSAVSGLFTFYRGYGGYFYGGTWSSYQSVFVTVQSVLVFHVINSLDLHFIGRKARKLIGRLSLWTLGGYLCSEIFDSAVYPILRGAEASPLRRLLYVPVIIPAVAIGSLLLSGLLNLVYEQCERMIKRYASKRSKT